MLLVDNQNSTHIATLINKGACSSGKLHHIGKTQKFKVGTVMSTGKSHANPGCYSIYSTEKTGVCDMGQIIVNRNQPKGLSMEDQQCM